MITDIVLEPFGADGREMVSIAEMLDDAASGFGGIWVYDHFTAMVTAAMHNMERSPDRGRPSWSRDPFALLGAYASTTRRLTLGTLVANIFNRHTVQLAAAINTVQSLADSSPDQTRVICGIGSGAAAGSRFAVEHDAIGTRLLGGPQRRSALASTVDDLRTIWATNRLGDADCIVDRATAPRIVVGASGEQTVRVAAGVADGVNILNGPHLGRLVEVARRVAEQRADGDDFEVSVLTALDVDHPLGGDTVAFEQLGIDRRVLAVRDFPSGELTAEGSWRDRLERIAHRLGE